MIESIVQNFDLTSFWLGAGATLIGALIAILGRR